MSGWYEALDKFHEHVYAEIREREQRFYATAWLLTDEDHRHKLRAIQPSEQLAVHVRPGIALFRNNELAVVVDRDVPVVVCDLHAQPPRPNPLAGLFGGAS